MEISTFLTYYKDGEKNEDNKNRREKLKLVHFIKKMVSKFNQNKNREQINSLNDDLVKKTWLVSRKEKEDQQ